MSKTRKFHTDPFTRGGQIFTHTWTMRLQNFKTVLKLSLIFGIAGLIIGAIRNDLTVWRVWDFYILAYLGSYVRLFLWPIWQSLWGGLGGMLGLTTKVPGIESLRTTVGGVEHVSAEFVKHPFVQGTAAPVHSALLHGLVGIIVGMIIMHILFREKSKKLEAEQILSGKCVEKPAKVASLVRIKGTSDFWVHPDLPLPKGAENQHMSLIGATRMGKTNCLIGLLDQVRQKGDRAIVLDCTGELTARYFREGKDKLLNPLDPRSQSWDIWSENLEDYAFDEWAASMVRASNGNDPIWYESARKLLSYTALKLREDPERSMKSILEKSCWQPIHQVERFFANSPVASFMNKEAEKTAAGVRMSLNQAIGGFAHMDNGGIPFSIMEWVEKKRAGSVAFLNLIACSTTHARSLASCMV